ncbi:hypothetical protein BJ508DRAFT_415830 [Ascobolus immersus RN42]|uniref:Uncharacterized protein n=1 Tax=Ascobolus immersus RN42 TaxID=1160509 RepID=A0A3N4I0R0_ASCIM|nr:hypothetical protein BJ508DRAFT_415830 [Ascobolus immersus RN42]
MAALPRLSVRALRTSRNLRIASTYSATSSACSPPSITPRQPSTTPLRVLTRSYHASPPSKIFGLFKSKTPEEIANDAVAAKIAESMHILFFAAATHLNLRQSHGVRLLETLVDTTIHNYATALRKTNFDFTDVEAFQQRLENAKEIILRIAKIRSMLDLIPTKNVAPPFELVGLEPVSAYIEQYVAPFVMDNKGRFGEAKAKELMKKLELLSGQFKKANEAEDALTEEFVSEGKKLMEQLEKEGRMNIEELEKEWEVLLKEFEDHCKEVYMDEQWLDKPLQDLTMYLVMSFPDYFQGKRLVVEEGYENKPMRKEDVLYSSGSPKLRAARRKQIDVLVGNQIEVVRKLYEKSLAEKEEKQ